ncbi:ATP-binding cassette domain-containing protein [Vagococcus acidifermentans]|uniref:ABC transporter ATP-binding protein n=1 Tax=Vagococcus acidifermentans TaxID=564710 RepID=A0A430AL99_9ENTE|nr:ATP-binding cassette domain-containing protein [Vagococcus acidifermentans]RSU08901.1 ABC transporter ATP-binding protein [Vagococcus acidifermentans]
MNKNILLETKNLTKSFHRRTVVEDIDIKVYKGDIYGFLGRNGQGKTTIIRMLTGLVYPDKGTVTFSGYDLKDDFKNAINQVGAMVESPSFYGYLSGYNNLKLIANLIPGLEKGHIMEVLSIVGLENRAKDKVSTYSLGMKQRLGIANALLGNPQLIILDEPTNGLDPQGMMEIEELILYLAREKNITFFISSHLLHHMQNICNRIGIIHGGKLVTEDRIENLCGNGSGESLEDFYFRLTREV